MCQILESWAQSNVFNPAQLRNALTHVKGILRKREEEAAIEKQLRKQRGKKDKCVDYFKTLEEFFCLNNQNTSTKFLAL